MCYVLIFTSSASQPREDVPWKPLYVLEEEMVTDSRILAWKVPWTEEPDGLLSNGSQRVGYNLTSEHTHTHTHTNMLSKCSFFEVILRLINSSYLVGN